MSYFDDVFHTSDDDNDCNPTKDIIYESTTIINQMNKIGYREHIVKEQEKSFQQHFDLGFQQGMQLSKLLGQLYAILQFSLTITQRQTQNSIIEQAQLSIYTLKQLILHRIPAQHCLTQTLYDELLSELQLYPLFSTVDQSKIQIIINQLHSLIPKHEIETLIE